VAGVPCGRWHNAGFDWHTREQEAALKLAFATVPRATLSGPAACANARVEFAAPAAAVHARWPGLLRRPLLLYALQCAQSWDNATCTPLSYFHIGW